MACPGPPLCCDECCTHRLFIPEIEWSDNVFGKRCGRPLLAAPAVTASYRDGDFVYLVAEIPRLVDGVVRYGYYAEKWEKTGTREWRSDLLFTTSDTGFIDSDRSKATAITSDGSHCWVAIAENDATGGLSTMFRLDALDGDVLFQGEAGASDELTIYSLAPTGDNKCYIGHNFQVNEPWVSTWDDDTLTDRFGVLSFNTEHYVSSIIPDGTDIYLGHTEVTTDRFGACQDDPCDLCSPSGAVSRWNSDRELVWLSYGGAQAKIAKVGTTVFVACVDTAVYGALDEEWGDALWFRDLFVDPVEDSTCGMNITDIGADANFVWLSACRHVVQTDHDGVITSSVPHVHEDDIPYWNVEPYTPNGNQVLTVAAIQDDTAVGGGKANLCDPDEPLEPDERISSEVTCDSEATDFCTSSVPGPGCGGGGSLGEDNLCYAQTNVGWCNINQCGVVSTNGRVAISECTDHEQWPKCSGPGIITYTDCNDEVVTETLRFSSHCVDGGWRWFDSWDGGSIAFTVPCDGSFGPDDIDLTIDGCTVTVDSASITCDGPLGYASMEFTFSGSCSSCNINGCGAFGAESCEILISNDCCPGGIPATLTASITGCSTETVSLSHFESGGNHFWTGTFECDGNTFEVVFECNFSGGSQVSIGDFSNSNPAMDYVIDCSPFEASGRVESTGLATCCGGSDWNVVITE